ncbi:MAG: hypothetical protein J7L57_01300 [Deltaproteobacteria bacterium]|nr:hypothetical protein [Candidatus Tharpella sp.]
MLILQTSTPAAIPLLYAVNYDTHPEMVAGTILVSTVLSVLILTGLLFSLGV